MDASSALSQKTDTNYCIRPPRYSGVLSASDALSFPKLPQFTFDARRQRRYPTPKTLSEAVAERLPEHRPRILSALKQR